jgi:hypothetical protein
VGEHSFAESPQDRWFELASLIDQDRLNLVDERRILGRDVVEDPADAAACAGLRAPDSTAAAMVGR